MWQGSWVRPWYWVIPTTQMSRKIIRYVFSYLQSWEILSNTAFPEFGLAKSDLRQSSWPKVKFKEDPLNIFHFTLAFFHALFKRCIISSLISPNLGLHLDLYVIFIYQLFSYYQISFFFFFFFFFFWLLQWKRIVKVIHCLKR